MTRQQPKQKQPGYFQRFFRGSSGYVALRELRLHGFTTRGRSIIAAFPGLPGEEIPARLNPELNWVPQPSFSHRKSWGLVLLAVAVFFMTDQLHVPKLLAVVLLSLLGLGYVFWPLFGQVGALRQWAKSREMVTLVLNGREPFEVHEIHRSDTPQEWPADAPGVMLVVYDLSPAERVRLVRSVVGYQAMQRRLDSNESER